VTEAPADDRIFEVSSFWFLVSSCDRVLQPET
jgi:hypothetical protein